MVSRSITLLLAALFLSTLTACSGGSDRNAVNGKVSLDGEIVDVGHVIFVPVDAPGAIKTGGQIVDGVYDIAEGFGPPPGKYKVVLSWDKKTGETYIDADSGDEYDKRAEGLPAEYLEMESPLEVDIVAGKNTHDFILTSK